MTVPTGAPTGERIGVATGSWPRALVIANPAASTTHRDLVDEVAAACRPHAGELSVYWTRYAGDAQRAAQACVADGVDLVVSIGGDGTIREVAEGIARGGPPGTARPALLPVPAGGGNSVCRGVWGDDDRRGILEAAFDPDRSRVRRLDLLRIAELDRASLLGVSTGLLAEVLIASRQESAELVGRERYYAAAPKVLATMSGYPCRVAVDGAVIFDGPASLVNIGGGRYRAWALQLLPRSVLDDGLADVCVLAEMSGAELAGLAPAVGRGEHLGDPRVSYARGRQVVIERTDGEPLVIEYDGESEARPLRTLTVDVLPGALPVVAPRHAVAG
jgi:diacylglycerol kinase (ATP)